MLSLSTGGSSIPFYEDGIALGAFSAIQKGIIVPSASRWDFGKAPILARV